MRTLTPAAIAAINTGQIAVAQLVHMAFTVPIALNSSTWALVWDSVTYQGAYGLGTVSAVTDQPGQAGGVTFEISGASVGNLGLALDAGDEVQGVLATVRTAIVRTSDYTVVDAPVDWVGKLDTMAIGQDGATAVVRVTAESQAVNLLRGSVRHYSDSDQRRINSADGFFRHTPNQAGVPFVWPARSYFYQ